MKLSALRRRLDEAGLLTAPHARLEEKFSDIEIDHLAEDSRAVGPGGLFVAIRGTEADGHLFIDKAAENGAAAIACEAVPAATRARLSDTAFVVCENTRAAAAELAAAFYSDPARDLQMIGITGTNGKTTTAFLAHHLLGALGTRAGLLGTIRFDLGGGEIVDAPLTTPGPTHLHRMLRQMVKNGCAACVMEVSSHALVQERTRAVPFGVGVFTNLTPEHLDYHATLADYRAAKKKLFDGLGPDAIAIYNADDENGPAMVADTAARRLAFGQAPDADVRLEVIENALGGLRLRMDGGERRFRLVGRFNAYNLAAAYGIGRALGYEKEETLDALAEAPPVPGRFEQMRFPDGTTAVVDYAHTPDALENVLSTLRRLKPEGAKLWCIFGCGGDRDRTKRRTMGRLAEHLADRVIVTSDNPRTEDPGSILSDIRRGMDRPTDARWITDRRAAIRTAAREAAPGDVVLIAGKGHEAYQVVGDERLPFDDREEVRKAFSKKEE